jgi:nucleotide-binding universal stress UspA family protein
MAKKIAVGFDGSTGSWKALKEAARLASLDQAKIFVISIEELPSFPSTVGEVIEEQDSKESCFHKIHSEAEEVLLRAGMDLKNVSMQIKIGHPAKKLTEYVTSINADLLVLGHSGHSGVWGSFLGTTADKVIRHATSSVLVVR